MIEIRKIMTIEMKWHNPPESWSEDNGLTRMTTQGATDFCKHTHYGFVRGQYNTLYDQAGLMLRHDSSRWIKAGVEFTDNLMHFCVVVTNQRSHGSLIPLPEAPPDLDLGIHILRIGQTINVRYRLNQGPMRLAPIAALPYEDTTQVGMMCCSPERAAEFRNFKVGEPLATPLHQ